MPYRIQQTLCPIAHPLKTQTSDYCKTLLIASLHPIANICTAFGLSSMHFNREKASMVTHTSLMHKSSGKKTKNKKLSRNIRNK